MVSLSTQSSGLSDQVFSIYYHKVAWCANERIFS